MRLWHQSLIKHLPRQQLLGQHRECCALRSKGWGRNHSVVNYVFEHNPARLVAYHRLVMDEMKARGYNPNEIWYKPNYRGTTLNFVENWVSEADMFGFHCSAKEYDYIIFPEHNDKYLQECIDNLKNKGIEIEI